MKNIKLLSFLLYLSIMLNSIYSAEVKIVPSDDMYTDEINTGAHAFDQIWVANYAPVSNYQRIMMKFDLSELQGNTIDKAELNIYRFFGCPSGGATTVRIYPISEEWDENTWSETKHIGYNETTQYGIYAFSVNGMHTIDITDLVKAWADGTIENNGLVMVADANCKFAKCYSKEASNSEFRPYLNVEVTPISDVNEEDDNIEVNNFELFNNYPNPFNPSTEISFKLPETSQVSLIVYDITGMVVAEIVNNRLPAGYYSYNFNADNLCSGIYLYSIKTEHHSAIKKMILLK